MIARCVRNSGASARSAVSRHPCSIASSTGGPPAPSHEPISTSARIRYAVSTNAHEAMEREVVALVHEIASRFDRARMEGPTPEPPAGLRVESSCAAPGTARVVLYASDHDIDVHIWAKTHGSSCSGAREERRSGCRSCGSPGRRRPRSIRRDDPASAGHDHQVTRCLVQRGWRRVSETSRVARAHSLVPDPRAERSRIAYEAYS